MLDRRAFRMTTLVAASAMLVGAVLGACSGTACRAPTAERINGEKWKRKSPTTRDGVVVGTNGLRSIPANGWPEWDLSYVGKGAGWRPAVRHAK